MVGLSFDTEVLVRRLAEARRVSVDEAVRQAVAVALSAPADTAEPGDLAARRLALLDAFADRAALLPDRDPRSSREIMDDLTPL